MISLIKNSYLSVDRHIGTPLTEGTSAVDRPKVLAATMFRFKPQERDGTGDLFVDDGANTQLLENAADFVSPELAIGLDDHTESAQALAAGVTMVAFVAERRGVLVDQPFLHTAYSELRAIEPFELGGLLQRERRRGDWDLPVSEVERWAEEADLLIERRP